MKNIHDSKLFPPITLRRLGTWSLAMTVTTGYSCCYIVTSYSLLVVLPFFVWHCLILSDPTYVYVVYCYYSLRFIGSEYVHLSLFQINIIRPWLCLKTRLCVLTFDWQRNLAYLFCFSVLLFALNAFEANYGNTLRGKNGLHAFGYNSAESEPIRVKSAALCAHCWGLALADFGRDSRCSDSSRGSRNFVFFLSGK